MKRTAVNTGLAALLAVVVFITISCAKNTGFQQQEKTTATMSRVENDMQQVTYQIDTTNASLDYVMKTADNPAANRQDVKTAFNAFSDNVKKMDQVAAVYNKDVDQMNTQGNAYFEEWRKEGNKYVNPNIQALSEERRTQLQDSFTNIGKSSVNMRASMNAYVSDIKQIQTYLSTDLTSAGIAAITPIAQTAQNDGSKVKADAQPVQTAIDQTRMDMTPGTGAAAGGGAASQGTQPGTMSAPTTTAPAGTGIDQNNKI